MEHEMLFRGKRTDNGEWVEGWFFKHLGKSYILPLEAEESEHTYFFDYMVEVDPSTVGRYTGLTDKNDKKIFQGDVLIDRNVTIWEDYVKPDGSKWSRSTDKKVDEIGVVKYQQKGARFLCDGIRGFWWMYVEKLEVIGNIHDNPELLETTP